MKGGNHAGAIKYPHLSDHSMFNIPEHKLTPVAHREAEWEKRSNISSILVRPLRYGGLLDSARSPTAFHLTSLSGTEVYSAVERAISSALRERTRSNWWSGIGGDFEHELFQLYVQNGSILFSDDCRKCFTLPLQESREPDFVPTRSSLAAFIFPRRTTAWYSTIARERP